MHLYVDDENTQIKLFLTSDRLSDCSSHVLTGVVYLPRLSHGHTSSLTAEAKLLLGGGGAGVYGEGEREGSAVLPDLRPRHLMFSDFPPQNCLPHSSNRNYLELPLKSLISNVFLLVQVF